MGSHLLQARESPFSIPQSCTSEKNGSGQIRLKVKPVGKLQNVRITVASYFTESSGGIASGVDGPGSQRYSIGWGGGIRTPRPSAPKSRSDHLWKAVEIDAKRHASLIFVDIGCFDRYQFDYSGRAWVRHRLQPTWFSPSLPRQNDSAVAQLQHRFLTAWLRWIRSWFSRDWGHVSRQGEVNRPAMSPNKLLYGRDLQNNNRFIPKSDGVHCPIPSVSGKFNDSENGSGPARRQEGPSDAQSSP